jgi:hypothetical protein
MTDFAPSETMQMRSRIRACTWFLIVGLVLSGLTAIPIQFEMTLGRTVLGDDLSRGGHLPGRVVTWLRTLDGGITATAREAPFMFYGTDWLAFGHFMIAIMFVGALTDPVRNRWLYRVGMIASLLVPVWAAVFGPVRGIPIWWRLIDASFGVVAFIPAWLCYRWTGDLEASEGRGMRSSRV